jgi:beta-glucanase (GH16 family)
MHRPFLFLVPLLAAFSGLSAEPPSPAPAAPDPAKWELVWKDEFETDGAPDPAKWGTWTAPPGSKNHELQYYTDRLENVRVEKGMLVIEARKETYDGKPDQYTSTELNTRHKADWTYGRFEVRAKLPKGRGTWPAIWMMGYGKPYGGWPRCGELDIMEHVGYDPGVIHTTLHTGAYNHPMKTQRGKQTKVDDCMDAFHVYALEWLPTSLKFYIDDRHVFTFLKEQDATSDQWPFDKPFCMILNIAVGGDWGGAKGVDPDIWPQRMEVDYVRVYKPLEAALKEPAPVDDGTTRSDVMQFGQEDKKP